MILYRALNEEDMYNLQSTGKITSSLINSYNNIDSYPIEVQTKINNFYNKCCCEYDKSFMFSLIYGHTNGKLLLAKRSPWISATNDFFTAYNYAKLNKCKWNTIDRRYIICFEIKEGNIIKNICDLQQIPVKNGTAIDLTNNKLAYYRMKKLILPFGISGIDRDNLGTNFSISNFSTSDNQYLISNSIDSRKYLLLSPEVQDKLVKNYGMNVESFIETNFSPKNNDSLQLVKKMV